MLRILSGKVLAVDAEVDSPPRVVVGFAPALLLYSSRRATTGSTVARRAGMAVAVSRTVPVPNVPNGEFGAGWRARPVIGDDADLPSRLVSSGRIFFASSM